MLEEVKNITDSNLLCEYEKSALEGDSIKCLNIILEIYTRKEKKMNQIIKINDEEIERLKKENQELREHVLASPDGELYFQSRDHYLSLKKI